MRGKPGDKALLNHIIEAIEEVESYLTGADLSIFMSNSMMRFACIKQLEIIGEASNHISKETKERFTDIEWLCSAPFLPVRPSGSFLKAFPSFFNNSLSSRRRRDLWNRLYRFIPSYLVVEMTTR